MTTLGEIRPTVATASAALRSVPHVVAVGVGDRETGGEVTGELAVKVFVNEKLPRSALGRDDLVPSGFGDLRADVVSLAGFRRRDDDQQQETPPPPRPHGDLVGQSINDEEIIYAAAPGKPPSSRQMMRSGRHGVLEGGMGVSAGYGAGTIGCFLEDQLSGDVYALTNDHVLRNDRRGRALQPGRVAGSSNRVGVFNFCCTRSIGDVHVSTHRSVDEARDDPLFEGIRVVDPDAGLVRLDEGERYSPTIHHVGPIYGVRDLMSTDFDVDELLAQRFQVLKRGRTTGTTGGFVVSIVEPLTQPPAPGVELLPYDTTGMITMQPNGRRVGQGRWYLADGDSGSVSIDLYGNVVGLNHSSNPASTGGLTAATPIKTVLDSLEHAFELEGHTRPVLHVAAHRSCDDIVRTVGGATARARRQGPDLALDQLTSIGVGRELGRVWDLHAGEIIHLINTNRRVGTVWHRSGVLQVVQHLLRLGADPDRRMPLTIDGRSPQACIDRFADELVRWGSPALERSIATLRGRLPEMAGQSHAEILLHLERAG